jgi:hypothetical protein
MTTLWMICFAFVLVSDPGRVRLAQVARGWARS